MAERREVLGFHLGLVVMINIVIAEKVINAVLFRTPRLAVE